MINLKQNFFYPLLGLIISIIFCVSIWDLISLKYTNYHEIIGEYSLKSHHNLNDTLRFIVFITIPILVFFIIFFKTKNDNDFNNLNFNIFFLKKDYSENKLFKKKIFYIYFFSIILFFLGDWSVYPVQIFEDGISLSGSTLLEFEKKPWTDVYINTGFFYDMLNAKIAWLITGFKTIGSFKFYIKFLNLITLLCLFYFLNEISNQIDSKSIKGHFFLLSSLSFIFIFKEVDIWRDLPLILFLIFILKYINTKNFTSIIIISLLSVITFFWSLDRGFFILFSLIPFLIFIFINDKKELLKFLITIFIFCFLIKLSIDPNILREFFNHTKDIFIQHESLNGIIHPKPFSDDANSSRATKSLLLIIINFLISILIIFNKKELFLKNTKFIFFFYSIINLLIYKSALSRSDGGHIKMATYLSISLFVIFIIFFTLNYLSKKKEILQQINKLNYVYVIFFILTLDIFTNSYKNVYEFPKNIKNYLTANDELYLDKNYYSSIETIKKYFSEENCLQVFSYDQAIFYLLKKSSCSKFYNVWVIGSKKNQDIYIREIKLNKPKFILTGGITEFKPLGERYPYIKNYIEKEYFLYETIGVWSILKKNL